MDPLSLGAVLAVVTVLVLFSGVSVAVGLLIVSAGFLLIFDGARSLQLLPEIFFGKLDNFALLVDPHVHHHGRLHCLHARRCRPLRGA